MIDRIGAVHIENDTELLWLIGSGAVWDENQMGQWCDQLYKTRKHKDLIDRARAVYAKIETKV